VTPCSLAGCEAV